jgi:hypothetical protein
MCGDDSTLWTSLVRRVFRPHPPSLCSSGVISSPRCWLDHFSRDIYAAPALGGRLVIPPSCHPALVSQNPSTARTPRGSDICLSLSHAHFLSLTALRQPPTGFFILFRSTTFVFCRSPVFPVTRVWWWRRRSVSLPSCHLSNPPRALLFLPTSVPLYIPAFTGPWRRGRDLCPSLRLALSPPHRPRVTPGMGSAPVMFTLRAGSRPAPILRLAVFLFLSATLYMLSSVRRS